MLSSSTVLICWRLWYLHNSNISNQMLVCVKLKLTFSLVCGPSGELDLQPNVWNSIIKETVTVSVWNRELNVTHFVHSLQNFISLVISCHAWISRFIQSCSKPYKLLCTWHEQKVSLRVLQSQPERRHNNTEAKSLLIWTLAPHPSLQNAQRKQEAVSVERCSPLQDATRYCSCKHKR